MRSADGPVCGESQRRESPAHRGWPPPPSSRIDGESQVVRIDTEEGSFRAICGHWVPAFTVSAGDPLAMRQLLPQHAVSWEGELHAPTAVAFEKRLRCAPSAAPGSDGLGYDAWRAGGPHPVTSHRVGECHMTSMRHGWRSSRRECSPTTVGLVSRDWRWRCARWRSKRRRKGDRRHDGVGVARHSAQAEPSSPAMFRLGAQPRAERGGARRIGTSGGISPKGLGCGYPPPPF